MKDKLKAVETAKIPQTKEKCKSFVGLCNFFRSHIKDFARIWEPLHKATREDADYLKGNRFILYTEHKPLESIGILHNKTMNRQQ